MGLILYMKLKIMMNYAKPIFVQIFLLLSFFLAGAVHAQESFKVSDIKIEGLQRVEPGTVFTYFPVKVGDTVNSLSISSAIQSLFSSGLFADVKVDRNGSVLLLQLQERPFISSITLSGNKEFDTEELSKMFKEIGFTQGRVFDRAVAARAEQEVKRMYLSKSKYGLKLNTVSSPLAGNLVSLRMEFNEGDVAKIKEIKFYGNKKFPDSVLRDEMYATTPGMLTWLTKYDRYAKEKLSADLISLKDFYSSKGYFEFAVDSSQVTLSTNRDEVYLSITVKEGEQFKLGAISLSIADNAIKNQVLQLQNKANLKEGTIFVGEKLNDFLQTITKNLSDLGYANAQITPNATVDNEKQTVAFDINIDTGPKVYVRKINIVGNKSTRDSVIRREVRQVESAIYNDEAVTISRDRIDRLGFFKTVELEKIPVDGRRDLIDIQFSLVEKDTGNISLGLGFNSTDKISITAGYSQDNIFGSGNNFAFSLNTGASQRALNFSITDPYFTNSGISRTLAAYYRVNKQKQNSVELVDVFSKGFSIGFGVPVTEFDTISVGAGFESTRITQFAATPTRYTDFYNPLGNSASYPLVTAGWFKDRRNSALSPTNGTYNRLGVEVALGKDVSYSKLGYQFQNYTPLSKDYTIALNLDLGLGKKIKGNDFPFFKNYYVGGIGSVRGFEGATLGPKVANNIGSFDYLGGAKKAVFNTEFLMPMPGTGKDRSARLFSFIDGGYSWDDSQAIQFKNLRLSYGIGMSWISPIGPLKFSLAFPTKKETTDKLQKFQFQIGTGF